MPTTYSHTQTGPLSWLLAAIAASMLVAAVIVRNDARPTWIVLSVAAVIVGLCAISFRRLTVADQSDRLGIRFGPLPLFHRAVRYAAIQSATVARTTIWDGWGIHYSIRGGWVWNLWGRDCVEVKLRRGRLWIGSDDAANLAKFLTEKATRPAA